MSHEEETIQLFAAGTDRVMLCGLLLGVRNGIIPWNPTPAEGVIALPGQELVLRNDDGVVHLIRRAVKPLTNGKIVSKD